ncbi:hypothetical protein DL96DRAFT_1812713 [Flagelloscypha sp. PMI_526]|nr:hypothetical protein DL96DRAFT_1812713 [Flagelloscypha sp. PMI_526]
MSATSEESTARQRLNNYSARSTDDKTKILLTAVIDHAPNRLGVVRDIAACTEDALYDVYLCYFRALIIPSTIFLLDDLLLDSLRKYGGFDEVANFVEMTSAERHRLALRKQLWVRDNKTCKITSKVDAHYYSRHRNERPQVESRFCDVTHVLPYSLHPLLVYVERRAEGTKDVAEVISHFGAIEPHRFDEENLNSLKNVFLAIHDIHIWFGILRVWLEPMVNDLDSLYVSRINRPLKDGNDNAYRYRFRKTLDHIPGPPDGSIITFTTEDSVKYPLPDTDFFRLHAGCAKVIQAAGMSDMLDD